MSEKTNANIKSGLCDNEDTSEQDTSLSAGFQGDECCDYMHAHKVIIESIKEQMPSEETLLDLSEFFRVFGDSTRIKILYVLFESELCVCDIAGLVSMTQSAISHQLKILRQMRLIKSRRQGKTVFYSLADEHVRSIIFGGMEHISE